MTNNELWQTKLHARLHDPAEKALVLLRDPAGHEGGTSKALHRQLRFQEIKSENLDPDNADVLHTVLFKNGIPKRMYETVQRGDWWAAAADRPQWPMEQVSYPDKAGETKTFAVAKWAQVRWTKEPYLVHPLTGFPFNLSKHGDFSDIDIRDIKGRSFRHFASLIAHKADKTPDWKKTQLAFWRFGPELREEQDNGTLGALWPLLPADTRVPDHSIWDHLDLTSAFAGAFAADPDQEAALLTLSIGPVQSFIEAARTTSDLWAGSHLLSRLAWEAMKPLCEELGPDAILFPRLRGVPQVDLWLRDECKLSSDLFQDCEWQKSVTDSNPLFSASLPNRLVAIVPRAQAETLARKMESAVREWLQTLGKTVVDELLDVAKYPGTSEMHCHAQMREQLEGFPEVHWAVVPFSLIRPRDKQKQTDLDTTQLSEAMVPFFGVAANQPCGFLDSAAWKVLQKEAFWDDKTSFFAPNPGVLYPAIFDLAERVLAAAKATRTFAQLEQKGWRCSLTGETEWLTTDPAQLKTSYRSQEDTLWTRIAKEQPSWAKTGEHLGALPAIKRLWPKLFAEQVAKALGDDIPRFVISTHSMALADQIDKWLVAGSPMPAGLAEALKNCDSVALPRKLMLKHRGNRALDNAKRIPGLLDAARDSDSEAQRSKLTSLLKKALGGGLEKYYALLMMDGDRMGAWLSGDKAIRYRESFHPSVQEGFDDRAKTQTLIKRYGDEPRALSPNRHLAISGALNEFSLHVARHVIEREYLGRLIYAGGDDVLAMLPVADLLPAMQRLRSAYSGEKPKEEIPGLALSNGFARIGNRLMRMMGEKATASTGAVIAHHLAPLSAVLRELRKAEKSAKNYNDGERDAFSLTVIKRSGGALQLTAKWGEPVALLLALRDFLADEAVSRRAAYHSLQWLRDLPEPNGDAEMLEKLLAYQFKRQAQKPALERHSPELLARRLAKLTVDPERKSPQSRLAWLANFLSVAEFLARETRAGAPA